MANFDPKIFKAYDIRATYPDTLNEKGVYEIVQSFAKFLDYKGPFVLGRDVRTTGQPQESNAARQAFIDAGVDVIDVGIISTDMLYFAVSKYNAGGGLSITASHNPREYTGMKMVREKSTAISSDTGLMTIRDLAIAHTAYKAEKPGAVTNKDIWDDYTAHNLTFIDAAKLKLLKLMLSGNFGMAVVAAKKAIAAGKLPVQVVATLDGDPNGDFPKGRPDPMIPERQVEASALVKSSGADLGVAWDGDADRCFFCDEKGNFAEGYYVTALLAEYLLKKNPGATIISENRLVWAVRDTVEKNGGKYIMMKPGHAFFKDRMRKEDALFAGEMSAHYYFHDNYYADSGMIPFLLMLELLSTSGKTMSELLAPYREHYPISGEINFTIEKKDELIAAIQEKYKDGKLDFTDGVSSEFPDWRLNLRKSNTEPLVRLNIEAKTAGLVAEKVKEVSAFIQTYQ